MIEKSHLHGIIGGNPGLLGHISILKTNEHPVKIDGFHRFLGAQNQPKVVKGDSNQKKKVIKEFYKVGPVTSYKWSYNALKWPKINGQLGL